MEECYHHNIYLSFLPAHTSHGLQLADNGPFNALKDAYRKELSQLQSLTDSAPVNKISFLRCLIKGRKAVTASVIKAAWRHTDQYPVSRQKALRHPEIRPNKPGREVDTPRTAQEEEESEEAEPVNHQFIMNLSKGRNLTDRVSIRRIADEVDQLQACVAFLERENTALKAEKEADQQTKKRRAIPNPTQKFPQEIEI